MSEAINWRELFEMAAIGLLALFAEQARTREKKMLNRLRAIERMLDLRPDPKDALP